MVSSIIGGVASLAGGLISGSAAKSAASTQADAANRAADLQNSQYQQNREDLMPWMDAGKASLSKLGDYLGTSGNTGATGYGSLLTPFTGADLQNDPGYQFTLQQGQAALARSQAAKGGLLSGAATKALTDYNQGLASTQYQNAFNNYNTNQSNIYNRLSGVAGTGQQTATGLGNQGVTVANNISGDLTSGGASTAAGQVANGNMWATGLTSVGNTLSNVGTSKGWWK